MLVSKVYKSIDKIMGQIRKEIKTMNQEQIQEFFEDLQYYVQDEANLY